MPSFKLESAHHPRIICGVDEAGRGPWAGPVVAGAVIFHTPKAIRGVNDSKQLSYDDREKLFPRIHERCHVGVGIATVEEIETLNIWGATALAMRRAVLALPIAPELALVDGNLHPKDFPCQTQTVVGGDALSHSIAAASIVAKVTRDRIMRELALFYPEYGFERHVGYGTKQHQNALREHGVTAIHRKNRWVRALLEGTEPPSLDPFAEDAA
jgi:ribonuclease HII